MGSPVFATDVPVSQQSLQPVSWASKILHGLAGAQTRRTSFNATVAPVVRLAFQHTFAKRLEPFSVFVPIAKRRLQSPRGQFLRDLCWARSTLRPGRPQQTLSVAHGGSSKVRPAGKGSSRAPKFGARFPGDALSRHLRLPTSHKPTRHHATMYFAEGYRRLLISSPTKRLGEQADFVAAFTNVIVIWRDAPPVRLHRPAGEENECFSVRR